MADEIENDDHGKVMEKFNSTKSIMSEELSFKDGESSGGGSIFESLSAGLTMKLNWNKLANRQDFWTTASSDDENEDPAIRLQHEIQNGTKTFSTWAKRYIRTVISSPAIVVATLLTFAALLAAGLGTLHALDDAYAEDRRDQALITARELGLFISSELDQALVPLFAMSQFVKHLDDFKQLPYQIGPRGQPGSAPPLTGKEISHRNVTGICDDPHTSAVFHDLAANVKKDAKMEGILVNVQLAP